MPKYTDAELKVMAVTVAADDAVLGEKSLRLYTRIALETGMDVQDVRERVLEMADA